MNSHQANNQRTDKRTDESSDKRIRLPMPDAENITVLTRELPNDPILPWHRFDSPWLQANAEEGGVDDSSNPSSETGSYETGLSEAGSPDAGSSEAGLPGVTEEDSAQTVGSHRQGDDTSQLTISGVDSPQGYSPMHSSTDENGDDRNLGNDSLDGRRPENDADPDDDQQTMEFLNYDSSR